MHRGYVTRQEKEWDRTRHLMAYVLNFSGFGARDIVQPKDLFELSIDKAHQKKMIRTMRQAMDLLNEFKRWL